MIERGRHTDRLLTQLLPPLVRSVSRRLNILCIKLGGAHLKKLRRAEGGTKLLWYFVWKITILRQKITFFSIAEGGAKIFEVFRVKNHDFILQHKPIWKATPAVDFERPKYTTPGADSGGGGGAPGERPPLKLEKMWLCCSINTRSIYTVHWYRQVRLQITTLDIIAVQFVVVVALSNREPQNHIGSMSRNELAYHYTTCAVSNV
jgi:hypothetical protein